MTIGDRIRSVRESKGIEQTELANAVGISKQTLYKYEKGIISQIPSDKIEEIAKYLLVSPAYLMGWDTSIKSDNLAPMPEKLTAGGKIYVLGKVPAGVPIDAIQDIVDEIEISEKMANDGHEYFALLVSGDSMYPEYMDGDVVIVRKQMIAGTGDDVVAYVNGYNATLKRLIINDHGITLRAINPAHETKTYSPQQVEELPVKIAGIVVEQRRNKKAPSKDGALFRLAAVGKLSDEEHKRVIDKIDSHLEKPLQE